jgi:hypothetical protein
MFIKLACLERLSHYNLLKSSGKLTKFWLDFAQGETRCPRMKLHP